MAENWQKIIKSKERIRETANSSESNSQDKSLENRNCKYVGTYLRWLGDKLDKEKLKLKHYPPPVYFDSAPCTHVGRDLAWIGDELDKRQTNTDKISDFAVDLPSCCVVVFGILCYVVFCGLRMRQWVNYFDDATQDVIETRLLAIIAILKRVRATSKLLFLAHFNVPPVAQTGLKKEIEGRKDERLIRLEEKDLAIEEKKGKQIEKFNENYMKVEKRRKKS